MLALLASGSAGAAPTPSSDATSVLIIPLCDGQSDVADRYRELLAGLREKGIGIRSLWRGPVRPHRWCQPDPRPVIRERFRRAEQLFFASKLEAAQRELEAIVQWYDEAGSLAGQEEIYLESHLFLAWLARRSQKTSAAEEHFLAAARLQLKKALDTTRFPPDVVRAYQRARLRVRRGPRVSLAVETTPAGAEVSLDGQRTCQSPCQLGPLAPGAHFLRIQRDGLPVWGGRIELYHDEQLSLMLDSDPRDSLAALEPVDVGPELAEQLARRSIRARAVILLAPAAADAAISIHRIGLVSGREQTDRLAVGDDSRSLIDPIAEWLAEEPPLSTDASGADRLATGTRGPAAGQRPRSWVLRTSAGAALLLSQPQLYHYQRFGAAGALSIEWGGDPARGPWPASLRLQLSLDGAAFSRRHAAEAGGFWGAMLGLRWAPLGGAGIDPWLAVRAGGAWTGGHWRPIFGGAVGLELPGGPIGWGPTVRYVLLPDDPWAFSDHDAHLISVGLALSLDIG